MIMMVQNNFMAERHHNHFVMYHEWNDQNDNILIVLLTISSKSFTTLTFCNSLINLSLVQTYTYRRDKEIKKWRRKHNRIGYDMMGVRNGIESPYPICLNDDPFHPHRISCAIVLCDCVHLPSCQDHIIFGLLDSHNVKHSQGFHRYWPRLDKLLEHFGIIQNKHTHFRYNPTLHHLNQLLNQGGTHISGS
jgi:hypothetical protein